MGPERGPESPRCTSLVGLVRQLVPYQFHAKLYRVPFEAIQREIVRYAPEDYRVLLYRRMMLRIAEGLANRDRGLALITGDSLGQVASQTLRNLVAVDAASRMVVFRPLAGTDKQEILATAREAWNVRYFLRAVSRLLPGIFAATARSVRLSRGIGAGGSETRCRCAGDARTARNDAYAL